MTSFIFPPSHRIRQRGEFELAFSTKALSNKWFSIHILDNVHGYSRLGMVVSKRIMPKSVARNFAKRLIREFFRLNTADIPDKDFVVKVRRNINFESKAEAKLALLQLMHNVRVS